MRVAASWSGGKESCLACYRAISEGFKVSHLLNFVSKDGRCMSHGLSSKLIFVQSQAIGIPIIQKEVTWETYEQEFKIAIHELKQMDVEGAVFGDINIQEHRDWVDRVCSEVDIKPITPLWGVDEEQILIDFMSENFEAIVVSVKTDFFSREWLRRKVNKSFLRNLQKLKVKSNISMCGESGEYHTFVTDGPLFKRRIKVLESSEILKNGYWFLDILKYELAEKRSY